ncbi:adenine-specific methyltransferase [Methanoculleus virus Blf4]|uniref:site-specific DNA-methyltransferase (cytosine-N(4)-specific) n=1 Tax=Methanoculleus virus Blf4 TaxID=3070925 RepID=A0AA48X5H2_9CAUD|nr:adenine-specific methyltransferase [Methanoculleus virus L4768]QXM18675.1 adenine-specific methyltransferase [Methanoculleus virus Blf4]
MRHTILNGDVIACLRSLPDACVQCVVTSPPYWGLRDYGVEGQIGLEPTPEEHVEKMVEVFREVRRVLRDDGTLWLNYGDCYAGSTTGADRPPEPGHTHEDSGRVKTGQENKHRRPDAGLKPKDLVGMPWRIAFALQADGWYLRSDIIWSKPNPMPESVTDRPTKSHEYMFLLTKRPRYFYDADAVREEQTGNAHSRGKGLTPKSAPEGSNIRAKESWHLSTRDVEVPGGRNRRTVWEIATQPMPEAHFATFPEALVEPCIKAGTSERGACPVCGAPWRRVVERLPVTGRNENKTPAAAHAAVKCSRAGESHVKTVGWEPSCGCETQDGEPVPCIVLDPFGGSGTVAKVARDLGRSSILIEINPEYVQIIKKRLRIGEQLDSGVCEYVVKSFLTEASP